MNTTTTLHDSTAHHTCPVWIAYVLASPLRRLFENPHRLVASLVRPGDRVIELGPGLGFFTAPVAKAAGPDGKVICVDIQEPMLSRLAKRMDKRGLRDRVETRLCTAEDFKLESERGRCDLALAIHVVHETPSVAATMTALATCLRPGGKLLLMEPPGHISPELWQAELAAAEQAGLRAIPHPQVEGRKLTALWQRS
jgi:ubiquinone/menaquinone biosynthesis C-methylase UbiE